MNVFITAISALLLGVSVFNEARDEYLGLVSNISDLTRQIILENKGI